MLLYGAVEDVDASTRIFRAGDACAAPMSKMGMARFVLPVFGHGQYDAGILLNITSQPDAW